MFLMRVRTILVVKSVRHQTRGELGVILISSNPYSALSRRTNWVNFQDLLEAGSSPMKNAGFLAGTRTSANHTVVPASSTCLHFIKVTLRKCHSEPRVSCLLDPVSLAVLAMIHLVEELSLAGYLPRKVLHLQFTAGYIQISAMSINLDSMQAM